MDPKSPRAIGYYVTEKKNVKMNWAEFGNVCRRHKFTLVKLDLMQSLEKQGPFFAIVHKMTEIILNSLSGDVQALCCLQNVESYIDSHPEVIVIDPLDCVRSLMDRSRCYRIVQSFDLPQDELFTPTFVDLTSSDLNENLSRLAEAGVTYPFVCKPSVSHGSEAHQMAVIFNQQGVADCKPPCVAQSFIIHNAALYKVYIVGDEYNVSERPSLKNFSACDSETIFFTTADVSKADSTSSLTVLDPEDAATALSIKPDPQRLQHLVSTLRRKLKMLLIGVDFVIERDSGRYEIIDINVFPSYEKFPHFFDSLMECIINAGLLKNSYIVKQPGKLPGHDVSCGISQSWQAARSPIRLEKTGNLCKSGKPYQLEKTDQECDQDDSGFDTGDSSDERKKKWRMDRTRASPGKKLSVLKGTSSRQNTPGKLSGKIVTGVHGNVSL